MHPDSCLFVTLDSCRFDTFEAADAPNLKAVAPLHQAFAPSYFTYGSHAAMFMGFTPGIPGTRERFLDPKFSKLFRLSAAGYDWAKPDDGIELSGRNIVHGFQQKGFATIGCGAVGWFNPKLPTTQTLVADFSRFRYQGDPFSVRTQVVWLLEQLRPQNDRQVFTFLNVGETHVPYWFEGAAWSREESPCTPFGDANNADLCRQRQRACLEYVDAELAPLLHAFSGCTVLVCADHGDCWGEDGLWEHGMHHRKTLEVPLLIRFRGQPVTGATAVAQPHASVF